MLSVPACGDKNGIELIGGPEDGFVWDIPATGKGEIGVLSPIGDGPWMLSHVYRPRPENPHKFDYCPLEVALVELPDNGPEGREGV